MKVTINKLKNINITISSAYIFYNIYSHEKVYFRCGIMSIIEKQEKESMRIYEPVILNKLSLSKKFPRWVLYARKSALSVRLMKLPTMIIIIVLKLYLSYKRLQINIAKIITVNKYIVFF